MAMSEDFPLTVNMLLSVLEVSLTRDKLEDMDVTLEMSASLKGPTLQTGMTQKWMNIFISFFL